MRSDTLATLSVIFLAIFYYGPDFHGTRTIAALSVAALWITGILWRRVHWAMALAAGWALFCGIRVYGAPVSPFLQYGDGAVVSLDSVSAQATAWVLLAALLVLGMRFKAQWGLIKGFSALCMLDSLYVLVQWARGLDSFDRGGFMGNASINACLIACTYPIWTRRYRQPADAIEAIGGMLASLIPILAILVSRSNMALFAFCGALAMPVLPRLKRSPRDASWIAVMIAILLLLGKLFMGDKMGCNSGRFDVWRASLSWWWHHANWAWGTGLGTFFIVGPNIQRSIMHVSDGFLLWMHSDWLQILFEQGVVGLVLALTLFAAAVWRAIRDGRLWIASSLAAYGITMTANFPVHLPLFALLGVCLVLAPFVYASLPGEADRTTM